jgi:hypothetical protein
VSKQIIDEFNSLPNDVEKWRFVADNQDKDIIVHCDNDDTFITIEGWESDDNFAQFYGYVGWSDGVMKLLEYAGIRAESV